MNLGRMLRIGKRMLSALADRDKFSRRVAARLAKQDWFKELPHSVQAQMLRDLHLILEAIYEEAGL